MNAISHPTPDFANTVQEAKSRFDQWKSRDPFPGIAPALLNTADFLDYVRVTGMLFPFGRDSKRLKPASYEMNFGEEVLYWDEKNERFYKTGLAQGSEICLRSNSITYVTPDTRFQVPDYLALRFNLQIKHVHRGILLGTGPLVDPGFVGRLMIPLIT